MKSVVGSKKNVVIKGIVGFVVFALMVAFSVVYYSWSANAVQSGLDAAVEKNLKVHQAVEDQQAIIGSEIRVMDSLVEFCDDGFGDVDVCEKFKNGIETAKNANSVDFPVVDVENSDLSKKELTRVVDLNSFDGSLRLTVLGLNKRFADFNYRLGVDTIDGTTSNLLSESVDKAKARVVEVNEFIDVNKDLIEDGSDSIDVLKALVEKVNGFVESSEGLVSEDSVGASSDDSVDDSVDVDVSDEAIEGEETEQTAIEGDDSDKIVEISDNFVDFGEKTKVIFEERIDLIGKFKDVLGDIDKGVGNVESSVSEREEREAAELAAASVSFDSSGSDYEWQESSNSGYSEGYSGGSSNSGNVGATYYLSASHCADAYNAQPCVDSTGVTTIDYTPWSGPFWIGGHNSGVAGVINSFKVGDTVVVSGSGAGTYKITGITDVAPNTAPAALGGGYVFQTCNGGAYRIAYATRI